MKTFTTIALVFCFYLFLGLALATQGQAEEHYIYKDSHGRLVISNKPPPAGSDILRKLELPEPGDPQIQQPDTKLEDSAKPPKSVAP